MSDKKTFEVARETLKQLTVRKLVPTPLNYQRIYCELAGLPIEPPFPGERLRDIAQALPAKTPGQQKQRALLESAITRLNWDGVKNSLMAYGGFSPSSERTGTTDLAPLSDFQPSTIRAGLFDPPASAAPALTADFFVQISRLIEYALPALGQDDDHFLEQTKVLVQALRNPEVNAVSVKQLLSNYGHRLSFTAEDQAEIKLVLLRLLHLIIENISHLSVDNSWLKGQVDALIEVCVPPITLRRLDDLEQRLKDVIRKQTEAKSKMVQAQDDMRQMLAAFIERLASMTESTSGFHAQMEASAKLIEQATSLEEIAPVLKEVVSATRNMAQDSLAARDTLQGMQRKAQATEAEISKLHQELDRVSVQARHDPLTGALNRQGLDETVTREVARVKRTEAPLCVALLDIDNFKKINDSLGHDVGDTALTHLAEVARAVMRPQDSLARYGGEEFVILLPDTPLDKGIEAMTRLQRELTKRIFMSGTEKVLITFSAGVAQLAKDESGSEAIKRADQGMYLAKRAGKNRVVGT